MEADFLAIYGIHDWDEELDAPTFFILAQRVFAYEGVMRNRVQAIQLEQEKQGDAIPLRANPALVDLVEFA